MFDQTSKVKIRVDDENPYWISFSDIMAGLLVIFILATLLLFMQLTQQQERLKQVEEEIHETVSDIEKANRVRSELLGDVKEALEEQGIEVEISDNDSVLTIPSRTLSFESDHADIPPHQEAIVEKIGITLLNEITKSGRDKYIDTIFVEGHTDSRPSGYKKVGNWLLSADRAISVWRYWGDQKTTMKLWELKNFRNQLMFSVSGYAETRRVEKEEKTDELHKKNRRIDLRFTMKQPKECEYAEITGAAPC
ncbi:MAG: OmpA family protein [Proteobacteria bacterium]|nr:OmpA family protein [Pseudomonadota bacterium]